MRIAVIGTGNIGGSLGTKWRAAGHDVVFGARNAAAAGPGGAPVRSVADALADAEVVLLAVPGTAAAQVVAEHGQELAGKVIIDAANNIGAAEVNSRAAVVDSAPDASYARAFSTLGWENFVDPPAGAALFFAADPAARPAVTELITATGLEPVYVGGGGAAHIVDGLLPLWFALVQQNGGNRKLAFRVVR
ncbi:MAG: NAD(P)-binding domain-containing protein [Streptosporangiaceae bacterium]